MGEAENTALLETTDLLLLNKEEALAFSVTTTLESALQKLTEAGAQIVCITDGKNGAYGAIGNQKPEIRNQLTILHCPCAPANVIDTTGAGDAFGVAATWARICGFDLKTILRAGSMNAASVVEHFGAEAGLLTDTDMRKRLEEIRLDVEELPCM
jgi:ribokinase